MSLKETLHTVVDKLGMTATILAIPTNILGELSINELFTFLISLLSIIWLILKIQNEHLSKKRLRQKLQTEKYVPPQNKDQS